MRYISLCSGVEAATLAWEPLGWKPVVFAEVDPFASAILAAKFPDAPNLGDVTKVNWKEYHGAADLVIFGSPCQSYSIAGLREGLADPRGQLMLECLAACRDIDPEWVLFENVPGLLSSDRGRSFETFLNAVAILWPRGGVAWRILDSQWFGVAQRRRRVFAVVNTRDWRRAAAVLLDENCLRGNPPSRSEAREAAPAEATGGAGASGGDGCLTPWDVQSRRIHTPDGTWPALYAGEGGGHGYVANDESIGFSWHMGSKAGNIGAQVEQSPTITNQGKPPAVAFAQNQRDEVRPEPVVMASGQSNAEIGQGGGCPDDSGEELQRPAHPVRGTTSNGLDVFPTLCATDGSKQFIDNQSVDGGRLLLVPAATNLEHHA